MNICIVTSWLESGAGYVSKAYMTELINQGNKVYIYARGGRSFEKDNALWDLKNVTWSYKYKPLNIFDCYNEQYIDVLYFEKWLKKKKIQIIIFNEEHGFLTIKRVKKLGYCVGAYIDYYKRKTINDFKIYDFYLCNTQRHYSVFKRFDNCFYLPWGTDINLFNPDKKSKNNEVVFFHSAGWGGVNNRKGTDLLVKAFQKVKGNTKLIIHSQAPISKYSEVSSIINNDPRITFIEKQVSAPGLYHIGDVFVYPTRLEGIGLCVPEALSCGLPVITGDSAPMNEFVKDNVNGLLVRIQKETIRADHYYWPEKEIDIDDLSTKMQLYIDDKKLLSTHKTKAREYAVTYLNWKKNVKNLSTNLQSIVSNKFPIRSKTTEECIFWFIESNFILLLSYIRKTLSKLKTMIANKD